MTKLILLVDDDDTLLEMLSEHLEQGGYQTATATNGKQGLQMALEQEPDLVLLDVMMPDMDGWEVCKRLRESSAVPVIMLTAKGEEIDKLLGFRVGVDDYVTKPFSFAEVSARVGAVISRASREGSAATRVESGDLSIDLEKREVRKEGMQVDLTPTEYRLLEVLMRSINRPVASEKLLEAVWGPEYSGEVEHVKHYIWALRKKLETDPGDPQHIFTERGFGYRFG